MRVWDLGTGKSIDVVTTADSGSGEVEVVFSPDGRFLAAVDADGNVRIWNPATGQPAGEPIPAAVNINNNIMSSMVFSPDGRLLATADSSGTVRLWDPVTGKPVGAAYTEGTGNGPNVNGLAFTLQSRYHRERSPSGLE